jgi:hypothetical protein
VTKVTGTASYQVPGQPSTPISEGTTIPEGAVVTTGAGSSIDAFLGRNTGVIHLTQNSVLRIEKLQSTDTGRDSVTETQLQLQEGQLYGQVNKQTAASTYVVTLPDGSVEASGKSRFQVSYQATETLQEGAKNGQVGQTAPHSIVRVLSGHVAFAHEGTTTPINGSGQVVAGSPTVTPISSEASREITKVFDGIKTGPTQAAESAPAPAPKTLAVVAPQDIPLSPTSGSAN